MLKQKLTGSSGHLPPDLPGNGPEVTVIPVAAAANQERFGRSAIHARRMRRSGRVLRSSGRNRGGWSLGLW